LKGKTAEVKKLKESLNKRNTMIWNSPSDAEVYSVAIYPGDIFIFCTDGVFDNLFNHEFIRLVKELKHESVDELLTQGQADLLAKMIAEEAYRNTQDPTKRTPFQRKFRKAYNSTWEVRIFVILYREEKKMISLQLSHLFSQANLINYV
jgi:serine/threonine protein phosphatase PrpC